MSNRLLRMTPGQRELPERTAHQGARAVQAAHGRLSQHLIRKRPGFLLAATHACKLREQRCVLPRQIRLARLERKRTPFSRQFFCPGVATSCSFVESHWSEHRRQCARRAERSCASRYPGPQASGGRVLAHAERHARNANEHLHVIHSLGTCELLAKTDEIRRRRARFHCLVEADQQELAWIMGLWKCCQQGADPAQGFRLTCLKTSFSSDRQRAHSQLWISGTQLLDGVDEHG